MKKVSLIVLGLLSIDCFSQIPVDGEKLITCFKQGEKGNCASVALIKASISVYGINNVFSESPLSDSSFEITLQNGKKYTLTASDLLKAEKSADFNKQSDCDDEIIKYANKCYAIMAKVRQEIEGFDSYEDALKMLERGAYTPTVYIYLGLEKNVKPFRRRTNVSNECGVVVWRLKHAAFYCKGIMDDHGRKRELTSRYYGRFQIVK
jgi:hypothetical protein